VRARSAPVRWHFAVHLAVLPAAGRGRAGHGHPATGSRRPARRARHLSFRFPRARGPQLAAEAGRAQSELCIVQAASRYMESTAKGRRSRHRSGHQAAAARLSGVHRAEPELTASAPEKGRRRTSAAVGSPMRQTFRRISIPCRREISASSGRAPPSVADSRRSASLGQWSGQSGSRSWASGPLRSALRS
jgi:hypothetical protein